MEIKYFEAYGMFFDKPTMIIPCETEAKAEAQAEKFNQDGAYMFGIKIKRRKAT